MYYLYRGKVRPRTGSHQVHVICRNGNVLVYGITILLLDVLIVRHIRDGLKPYGDGGLTDISDLAVGLEVSE